MILLLIFWYFWTSIDVVIFLLISITLDMAQVLCFIFVFFSNFSGIDLNYWVTFWTISLMTFIFFEHLKLTCIISKSGMLYKLILVFILIIPTGFVFFFFDWFLALRILEVDFPYFWKWLEICFCFYINNLFYYFFSQI